MIKLSLPQIKALHDQLVNPTEPTASAKQLQNSNEESSIKNDSCSNQRTYPNSQTMQE